ncbi:MAG: hypothetical protein WBN96_09960, partial [Gammaproteobacteria bacterium]
MASITSQAKLEEGLQPISSELYPTSEGQVSNQGMHIPDLRMLDGKNVMPTLKGYTSYFGQNSKIGADAIPSYVQDVLCYRTFSGNTILIALVRDGLYIKSLAGDGTATVTTTATEISIELENNENMGWTRVLTTVPTGSWENWTHCIIRNKLYLYQKGLGKILRLDSIIFGEFALALLDPTYIIGTGQKNEITITGEEGLNEGTYKEFEYLVDGGSLGKFRIDIATSTQAYTAPEQWEQKLPASNLFSVHANVTTRTKTNWENYFNTLITTNSGGRYPEILKTFDAQGSIDGTTSEFEITGVSNSGYGDWYDSPYGTGWVKIDFTIETDYYSGDHSWTFTYGADTVTFSWLTGASYHDKIQAVYDAFAPVFGVDADDRNRLLYIIPSNPGELRVIIMFKDDSWVTGSGWPGFFEKAFRLEDSITGEWANVDITGVPTAFPGTFLSNKVRMASQSLGYDHDRMTYMGSYNVHFATAITEVLPVSTPMYWGMAGWVTNFVSDGVTDIATLMRAAAIALANDPTNDLELLYDAGGVVINYDNPNFDPITVVTSHWGAGSGAGNQGVFGIAARIDGGVVTGAIPAAAWDYVAEPINYYTQANIAANGFNTGDATFC